MRNIDARSHRNLRHRGLGWLLAYLLCIASPAVPQALPNPQTGLNFQAPNQAWIRSVQSLGNGGTAVRYIAANSITAPAGATVHQFAARGVVSAVPAAFRSSAAVGAIRTVCAERRACLIALGAAGALSTLGIVASLGPDNLPSAPIDPNTVDLNVYNYPITTYSEFEKNTEGNGVTATSITRINGPEVDSMMCNQYYLSGAYSGQCRVFTIYKYGEITLPPVSERMGYTWSTNSPSNQGGCWAFSNFSGQYVYPDQWCSAGYKLECSGAATASCGPNANNPRYAQDEYQLGNIILNPNAVTITADQARRVMEQTTLEPAKLGESNTGRAVLTSLWNLPSLAVGSYATPQEIISEGLDNWGATDAQGQIIGNPQTGWDPRLGQGISEPQPSTGYISDPSQLTDPDPSTGGGGGGTGPNIPQPPYDVNVINIENEFDDTIDIERLTDSFSIPSTFDYGVRWLPNDCPDPQTISVSQGSFELDYDLACQASSVLSYLVVAAGLFAAMGIVFRSAFA